MPSTLGTIQQKMKYTFDQPDGTKGVSAANLNTRKHRHRNNGGHHRNNSDDADPTDGSGSLTYSAASSINSAGESTDSSFADIMKVLDMHDPAEKGPLLKGDRGMTPAEYHMHLHSQQQAQKQRSSQASVAESLQYSTDGESNVLHGADFVSTITGQQSDSLGYDGGGQSNEAETFDNQNIMFAPAEPTDSLKKRKKEKRNRKKDSAPNKSKKAPNQKSKAPAATSSTAAQNRTRPPVSNRSTPPNPASSLPHILGEEDLCYSEWWMSCFPDSLFKEMMPQQG